MQKLPIGISVLKQIREGNYIYIDKTEYAIMSPQKQTT